MLTCNEGKGENVKGMTVFFFLQNSLLQKQLRISLHYFWGIAL